MSKNKRITERMANKQNKLIKLCLNYEYYKMSEESMVREGVSSTNTTK